MAETVEQRKFDHQQLLKAMIISEGLHDGIWMLGFEFSLGGANMLDEKTNQATPAAIVGIQCAVLTRVKELSPLAIDASVVNPRV